MECLDSNGARQDSKAWLAKATEIIGQLSALAPSAIIGSSSTFARIQSPSLNPAAYPEWDRYLTAVTGQSVTIRSVFVKEQQAATNIEYAGTFREDFTITLSGSMTQGGSQLANLPPLKIYGPKPPFPPPVDPPIPALTFSQQIYPANGPYFLGETSSTFHTAGENDAFSVIYRDLIDGFHSGFIGGRLGNSSDTWAGKPRFAEARPAGQDDKCYNQYAAKIEELSGGQVYGYAFSDVGSRPLMTITNSATLRIHILADDEVFS